MFQLKLLVRLALSIGAVAAILFGSAGRFDLPYFWAYLVMLAVFGATAMLTVSPDLLEERRKPAEGGRDNLTLLRAAAMLAFVSQWAIAGLDVGRFHGSDSVPEVLRVTGLVSMGVVFAVWYWAMRTNPFFSAAVRIQRERGHHVITSGPYRWVRHPGYSAFVLLGWGGAIALGSWWASLTHLVVVVLFVRRAMREDRMLLEELEGYRAYAAKVRYRFVPGVW